VARVRKSTLLQLNPPQPAPQGPEALAHLQESHRGNTPATPHGTLFAHAERPDPVDAPVARLHEHGIVPQGRVLNRDQELPSGDQRYERLFEIFERLENGQAALTERLAAEVPSLVCEFGYLASGTVITSSYQSINGVAYQPMSTMQPQTSDLEVIESIIASVPSGATGLLQLGAVTIPLSAGTTPLPFLKIRLLPYELRALSSTSAGPMAVVLMGHVYPTRGRMPL